MSDWLTIRTDATFRPGTRRAAWAFVATEDDGTEVARDAGAVELPLLDPPNNHGAEVYAFERAVAWATEAKRHAVVLTDSCKVVRHAGRAGLTHHRRFPRVTVRQVPRIWVTAAHALANQALASAYPEEVRR